MKNVQFVFLTLVGVTLVTGVVFFTLVRNNKPMSQSVFSAPIPTISMVPTQIPSYNAQVSSMDSPEGSKTLVLQKIQDSKGATYSAFVSSKSDEPAQQVFYEPTFDSKILSIPFNTWSPDNAYVFLKETTPTIDNYLVFQSSGNSFSNDVPYLSIQELFKKNVPDYTIEDITGWAGPNLLIVNAKLIEEDKKVSFWFELPSQSFIQLGTYFK